MPQFDTFIFQSSIIYLMITFFLFLYSHFNYTLPKLGSLLKLRFKITKEFYIFICRLIRVFAIKTTSYISYLNLINGFGLPSSDLPSIGKPLSNRTIMYIYIVLFTLLIIIFYILFQSTILLILFLIILSCFPFISNISPSNKLYHYTFPIVQWFINLLFDIKFLYVCKDIYDICISFHKYIYYIIFSLISLGCLGSLCINRYILYLRIENQAIPIYIYILYVLGILFILLRSLILFSLYIIPFIYNNLLMEPQLPESNLKPLNNHHFGGFFNKHHHIHNNYFRGFPQSNFNRNLGLGVAICGLGLSGYACYQYKLAALAAIKSANAAVLSADAAVRSANATQQAVDLAEVSAGIRSRESYDLKYPDSSRK